MAIGEFARLGAVARAEPWLRGKSLEDVFEQRLGRSGPRWFTTSRSVTGSTSARFPSV